MNWDDFRLEFDDDGTLRIRGRKGWREATCATCGQPTQWVMDMASFEHQEDGSFALTHATCGWKRAAFMRLAKKALDD